LLGILLITSSQRHYLLETSAN